jgi:predicted nucleotidyltransferase
MAEDGGLGLSCYIPAEVRHEHSTMNIQQVDRKKLLDNLHAVESKFPVRFLGLLPRGTAAHVFEHDAIDLLAEKLPGLSLTGLTGAEIDLSRRLKRPVGIVLKSELRGREEQEVIAQAQPL